MNQKAILETIKSIDQVVDSLTTKDFENLKNLLTVQAIQWQTRVMNL